MILFLDSLPFNNAKDQVLYVLLKALPPVCMKYTARGESGVANIARVLYLSRDPHQELYLSYKQSVSALSVLLYFYTY